MSVYAVEGLGLTLNGARLLDGVSFEVAKGGCTALVGASGSGKTMSCFAPFGLAPGAPTGSARLEGRQLIGLAEPALRPIRARAGFVFQQPLTALTPHLTIGSQLAEAARTRDRGTLAAMLDRCGLPEARLDHYPHRLSGGERQRALIAMATAHGPSLLVADEPTSALDASLRHAILDLLDRFREQGMGLLLVSHDLPLVAKHADRVVMLDTGKVVEDGRVADILERPQHAVTQALIAASPRLDSPAPTLPDPGAPLLSASGIHVRFGKLAAVCDASFDLREGEALALVGRSGSGKSTLARAVARLGPCDSGTVHWRGEPLPPGTACALGIAAASSPSSRTPPPASIPTGPSSRASRNRFAISIPSSTPRHGRSAPPPRSTRSSWGRPSPSAARGRYPAVRPSASPSPARWSPIPN